MKTIKLIVVVFIISISLPLSISAQNVGIDEPSPSEKLDVNGRIVAKGYKNTIYEAGGISAGVANLIGNTWTDLPDLSITFTLDAATTVISSYNLSSYLENGSFMMTRLMINGTEVDRIISGSYYYNNSDHYITELAAGTHTIKVQYRTNGEGENNPAGNDWQNRFLQVLVFGSN